jgi:FixJ family two-component response regulator
MTIPFIAIIDDDELLCSSLVDLLDSIGFRAEPFTSAQAFLTSAKLANWDCIIADINMPGMSGLRLLRELREQGMMTPVILITALPERHLDELAISTGALCLLRKPFETGSLIDYVEKSLQK